MRTHMTTRTIPWALVAAVLLAAGCGDDGDNSATAEAETAAGDSECCQVAVDWAVYEITPFEDTDPAACAVPIR